MAVIGVIAEYNPFHLGHLAQIQLSREMVGGGEPIPVIAVMSGNFVQRGSFAILDKHLRAEAACSAADGPDLVLELPVPYSCSTAEKFAEAGVGLLQAVGLVTHLSFGSEQGDLEPLRQIASFLGSDPFVPMLKQAMQGGTLFASAREAAVRQGIGDLAGIMKSPNNILGIEYLRALNRLGCTIEPMTIRRIGAGHDSEEQASIWSASMIRKNLLEGNLQASLAHLPQGTVPVYLRAFAQGYGPIDPSVMDVAVMSRLRRMMPEDYARLPDVREGLEYRLFEAVRKSGTLEEAIRHTKTKRYTLARIRRIFIAAFLGLGRELLEIEPPYLRVLAFNETGRVLLRAMKSKSTLPIITKPADTRSLPPEALRIIEAETLAQDLFKLASPSPSHRTAGSNKTTSPFYKKM